MRLGSSSGSFHRYAAIVAVSALLLVSCGNEQDEAPSVLVTSGVGVTDFADVQDWVTYASHVSVVRVLNEEALELPSSLPEGFPESVVARAVTVEIERILWTEGSVPKQVSFQVDGWQSKNGELRPMGSDEGPRMEVGSRYLVALADFGGTGQPDLGAFSPDSVFLLDGNTIRSGERSTPEAERFSGVSLDELEREIAGTEADPRVDKYEALTLAQQYGFVQAERAGHPPPRSCSSPSADPNYCASGPLAGRAD